MWRGEAGGERGWWRHAWARREAATASGGRSARSRRPSTTTAPPPTTPARPCTRPSPTCPDKRASPARRVRARHSAQQPAQQPAHSPPPLRVPRRVRPHRRTLGESGPSSRLSVGMWTVACAGHAGMLPSVRSRAAHRVSPPTASVGRSAGGKGAGGRAGGGGGHSSTWADQTCPSTGPSLLFALPASSHIIMARDPSPMRSYRASMDARRRNVLDRCVR